MRDTASCFYTRAKALDFVGYGLRPYPTWNKYAKERPCCRIYFSKKTTVILLERIITFV
jgi:hypothetical protein